MLHRNKISLQRLGYSLYFESCCSAAIDEVIHFIQPRNYLINTYWRFEYVDR
jgi:hypothetical protein